MNSMTKSFVYKINFGKCLQQLEKANTACYVWSPKKELSCIISQLASTKLYINGYFTYTKLQILHEIITT